jgi:hypothetical protein
VIGLGVLSAVETVIDGKSADGSARLLSGWLR